MQVQIFLLTSVEMSRPSSVIAGTVPECLLPVANREVLDIQLEALEKCGACVVEPPRRVFLCSRF